ncbi:hypothetical protein JKF63_07665 [Porcisia hertigi]|uniref:Uncharacterized protein n=1 Tax=Porcisia hertigi TaxID=2761500 RepID=A0A836LFG9_9TRYP|nr:hypothetical protein JKF63_07665 [Porcisia hertigi]
MTSHPPLTQSPPVIVATPALSEDVSNLLAWGRRLLEVQQQQRRTSGTRLSSTDECSASARIPSIVSSAAATSTLIATGGQALAVAAPTQRLEASASASDVLHTAADAPYTVVQARRRLAQLEELEETNTRVFKHRWTLLNLGRERLLRLHREARDVEAPSPRTRQLQRLTATAQAIVEGEASLKKVLYNILHGLSKFYLQQQQQREDGEDVSRQASMRSQNTGLVDSVHVGGASFDYAEDARAENSTSDSLCTLVDAVVRRTRIVLDSYYPQWQKKKSVAQHSAAATRLRGCAVREEEALRRELETLKSAVAEVTEGETHARSRLSELRAQCAATLQSAASLRERTTKEALQRLRLQQQHATSQYEVARQELAASEARYDEAKAAYDMAISDHHAAEEALAAAQQGYHLSERRREEAEGDLEELQQKLRSVSDKCDELRTQCAQTSADSAAIEKALHRKRHTRNGSLSGRWGGDGTDVGIASILGRPFETGGSSEHHAVAERELLRLEQDLQHSVEEVSALERTEAELRGTLEREKKALDLLCRQKKALEAYLASPDDGVDAARGSVALEI